MVWGILVLVGIFVASLWSAILIARRWNLALGVIGGFAVGAVGWLTATMLFWYFGR
jgi:hypothetical protein